MAAEITATTLSAPPGWALLQRELISAMEEAAFVAAEKYARPGGLVYHVHDVDDAYESRSMRGLLYAIGGDKRLLEIATREWNAITRFYSDETHVPEGEYVSPMHMPQLHNEYWNHAIPFNSDWFHMGEGNNYFYDFGLADPTNPDMRRRAVKFANMYTGDDPEAPNYDPKYRIIRSPFHGGEGPMLHAKSKHPLSHSGEFTTGDLELVRYFLDRESMGDFGHRNGDRVGTPSPGPLMTTLYPIVKELESNWFEDPDRRAEILEIFNKVVLNGDEPANLAATGLVTNAYLYTGNEKYKRWVLDYTDAWMDRIRKNDGIVPDNVGPTGKIGENRNGQWWGGLHGWNSGYSGGPASRFLITLAIASECAHLLSGDVGYWELYRSQIKLLLGKSKTRDDGQLLVPMAHGPEGWKQYMPLRVYELAHLYHGSMSAEDNEIFTTLRDGDIERDWNEVPSEWDRRSGNSEFARFEYYAGRNPDWPEKVLMAERKYVAATYEGMQHDDRDVAQIIAENRWPPNPVVGKGLTQVTMGAPQTIYNGGVLRATVRHFDPERRRPGLPPDVAALVDELGPDRAGLQLVNLSRTGSRRVSVQAGAFGEHKFTEARYQEEDRDAIRQNPSKWLREPPTPDDKTLPIDSKHVNVNLPPSTSVRLTLGMRRFVNRPSYAFPWHGGEVPVL